MGSLILRLIAVQVLVASGTPLAHLHAADSGTAVGGETQSIRFNDGRLTVKVRDLSQVELLEEIARQAGLRLIHGGEASPLVSSEFHALPLEVALRQLLRGGSYVLAYADGRPTALWVLPRDEADQVGARRAIQRPQFGSVGQERPDEADGLEAGLDSEDPDARAEAAAALGESEGPDAVAVLGSALADPDRDVREAAIESLAELGNDDALQALEIALMDQDPRIREQAVDAIGEIGGPVAVRLLQQALQDQEDFVREAAVEYLDESPPAQ